MPGGGGFRGGRGEGVAVAGGEFSVVSGGGVAGAFGDGDDGGGGVVDADVVVNEGDGAVSRECEDAVDGVYAERAVRRDGRGRRGDAVDRLAEAAEGGAEFGAFRASGDARVVRRQG